MNLPGFVLLYIVLLVVMGSPFVLGVIGEGKMDLEEFKKIVFYIHGSYVFFVIAFVILGALSGYLQVSIDMLIK